jgi:hypothetical protein
MAADFLQKQPARNAMCRVHHGTGFCAPCGMRPSARERARVRAFGEARDTEPRRVDQGRIAGNHVAHQLAGAGRPQTRPNRERNAVDRLVKHHMNGGIAAR